MRPRMVLLLLLLTVTTHAGVVKQTLSTTAAGDNLLPPARWHAYESGFAREGEAFLCDNGADTGARRGAVQTLTFDPPSREPIIAEAWSRAGNVGGARDSDYAIYLDLVYADGTPLWGQTAPFSVGTHDWEKRQVIVLPAKPVKTVAVYLLLRNHNGRAAFRGATLRRFAAGSGAMVFDGVPVAAARKTREGFQVRDVAVGGDFVDIGPSGREETQGLKLVARRESRDRSTLVDATLTDATGRDRAVTLVYSVPAGGDGWQWLADPRTVANAIAPFEYSETTACQITAGGRLSRWPFAAIARGAQGWLVGIDAGWPAFYRCGYHGGTRELFVAFDVGLAPEKPSARVRIVTARFDGRLGFRGALQRYYELFPDYFRCRTPEQGVWMPFHNISAIEDWKDFGFKFKEGNDETVWDDAHGILTFRYTEPMTWWMAMPKDMPRTLDAAVAEARRLAGSGKSPEAQALFTSGFHDENGRFVARLLDTPWCNGAVWSVNSLPGIRGETTDWSCKWGPSVREKLYGPARTGDLDGEYIDSSEGYVTDELDFRRDHFAVARLPLTFSRDSRKPAIFRGLIVAEYARQMAEDIHGKGKLMMANGTPHALCWLAPWLDVMGTETDWHPPAEGGGKRSLSAARHWQPMSDPELLYRRALCGPKPYCFLMNTHFPSWSAELTEKFMKRCLAYGMFPGFFSSDASTGHYFSQPALYNRDRPLFQKYIPLCRRVAEAGWQPLTRAHSNRPRVYVERFGDKLLTVFNDSDVEQTATVTLDGLNANSARELMSGKAVAIHERRGELALGAEDVAVLELQ